MMQSSGQVAVKTGQLPHPAGPRATVLIHSSGYVAVNTGQLIHLTGLLATEMICLQLLRAFSDAVL